MPLVCVFLAIMFVFCVSSNFMLFVGEMGDLAITLTVIKLFLINSTRKIEKTVYMGVISCLFAPIAKLIMRTKMLHLSNPMSLPGA